MLILSPTNLCDRCAPIFDCIRPSGLRIRAREQSLFWGSFSYHVCGRLPPARREKIRPSLYQIGRQEIFRRWRIFRLGQTIIFHSLLVKYRNYVLGLILLCIPDMRPRECVSILWCRVHVSRWFYMLPESPHIVRNACKVSRLFGLCRSHRRILLPFVRNHICTADIPHDFLQLCGW